MTKKTLAIFVLLAVFAALLPGYGGAVKFVSEHVPSLVLVVDPGHGGMDGGAQTADGVREEELNLAIAKALKEEGEAYGIQTILTRETGSGLYEEQKDAAGKWTKLGDMRARREIIAKSGADFAVSIHLNYFAEDSSVRGAQVFYPAEGDEALREENASFAKKLQEALNQAVNDEKPRAAMEKRGLFLLKDAERPSLLIECGFLSNGIEAARLQEPAYQKKIAQTIVKLIAEKYGIKGRNCQNTEIVVGQTRK